MRGITRTMSRIVHREPQAPLLFQTMFFEHQFFLTPEEGRSPIFLIVSVIVVKIFAFKNAPLILSYFCTEYNVANSLSNRFITHCVRLLHCSLAFVVPKFLGAEFLACWK